MTNDAGRAAAAAILERSFWIGGSPCAGKSTVAQGLAQANGLELYSVDEGFDAHVAGLTRERQPALTHWLGLSWQERWSRPVDELVREAIACYGEHFDLIAADVTGVPRGPAQRGPAQRGPILVEGTALLPERVAALGVSPQLAVWLVPTEAFQRAHYATRPWVNAIVGECADPELAFDNWMARDAAFARWVSAEAGRLGFGCLIVDGVRSLDEMSAWIAGRFGLEWRALPAT